MRRARSSVAFWPNRLTTDTSMPRGPRESQMGRVTVCDSARRFVPGRPGAIERVEYRAAQAKIEDGAPRSRSVPGSRSSGVGVWLDGAAAHPCPAACAVRSIGARCRPAPPATTPDRWYRTCPRAGVRDQIGLEFAVKLLVGAMVRIHAMISSGASSSVVSQPSSASFGNRDA